MNSLFRALSLLIAISSITSSCNNKSTDKEVINILTEGLEQSNKSVALNTVAILKSLEEKSTDYITAERARILLPKAEKVTLLSNSTFNYLEQFKKEAVFSTEKIQRLSKKIIQYKDDILDIDTSIRMEFRELLTLVSKKVDSSQNINKNSYTDFLCKGRKDQVLALITAIQANIRHIENSITSFLTLKASPGCILTFDSYSAIVGQNSNILKPGDEIEITAGVGSYSKNAQPKIHINGKFIPLNETGFSSTKIKTSLKPGTFYVPVQIEYFNPTTGKQEERIINVEYTVTTPCN